LKAPRLIARSFTFLRQVGRVGEDPQGLAPETDRDLTKNTETRSPSEPGIPVTLQGLRVQPPAATSVDPGRHGPGGRLAQLVRALP
jgi:hypothetical protein